MPHQLPMAIGTEERLLKGAASVAYNKIFGIISRSLGVSSLQEHSYTFFCGIGEGGKFNFAIALTFIALYAAVDG